MTGLGTLSGYSGLLSGPSRVETAQQELNTLAALNQYIEKDKQEDMMFQELEAAQYEEIRKEADTLLQRDRDAINQKMIEYQNKIKNSIKEWGGRKRFYQNGGVSTLKKLKTDILSSEEVGRYRKNKEDLEMIMKVQLAGKGHLLAKQDLQSLIDYQSGKSNVINYTGLKTEVEIPHEFYDYGVDISPDQILDHGDNFSKIYANWALENPDLADDESLRDPNLLRPILLKYTYENYGGKGSDKERLRQNLALHKEALRQERANNSTGSKDKTTRNYFNDYVSAIGAYKRNNPSTGYNILSRENEDGSYSPNNYIVNGVENGDSSLQLYVGNKRSAYENTFREIRTATHRPFSRDSYYQIASGMQIDPSLNTKVFESVFADSYNPETKKFDVKITSDGTYLKPNGEPFSKREAEFPTTGSLLFGRTNEDLNGTYTGEAVVLGWMDEDGRLATNVMDKNGEIDDVEQKKRLEVFGDKELEPVALLVLKNEKTGDYIYRKAEMTNMVGLSAFNQSASDVDVTGISNQLAENQRAIENVEAQIEKKKDIIKQEVSYSEKAGGGFASENFLTEAEMFITRNYKVEDPNYVDRRNILKAFYLGLSGTEVNSDVLNSHAKGSLFYENFVANLKGGALEFMDMIKNPELTEEEIVDEMVKAATLEKYDPKDPRILDNSYMEMPDYIDNYIFGETVKKYLSVLNNK